MSSKASTFRVIILYESAAEAERLTSMFQSSGKPCRAQHVQDESVLAKLLEDQSWDLIIAHDATESINPGNAIKTIHKYNLDIPVILLSDEGASTDVIEGMKLGAADVVKVDDDQHLLLVVDRELNNRSMRQETRRALRKLKEVERRNQQLLDNSRDGIAFVQDGMYLYANDSFAELFGYEDKDEIECMPIMDMIKPEDHEKVKRKLKEFSLQQDSQNNRLSFIAKLSNNEERTMNVELNIANYDDESCLQFVLPAKLQNTELLEAELESVKQLDNVTGLYNKQYILEAIDKSISEERHCLLSFIDIDNFMAIQDNLGHAISDQLLLQVGKMITDIYSDEAQIAHFGEDTFVVLNPNSSIETNIVKANELVSRVNSHIFDVNNKTTKMTLSIGVAPINDTITDAQMAINHARKAVEQVRSQNKLPGVGNDVHVYQQGGEETKVIISTIQKALANEQFKLLFQPIISLRGDDVEQYEVLLRMINDHGEEISPDNFLKTAASINACDKIDRWVILEAIKSLSEHRKKGNNTRIIINLSSSSSCDESLIPWLKVAFKAAQLPADSVIFQLHELDVSQHLNATRKFVQGIHEMNSAFCISRFGCALEPMSVLNHVPVDYVKLDGSFTQELQDNPEKDDALKALMSELTEKQKITIVPLVENASILSKLWQMGVDYIQGYYLQQPANGMNYDFDIES